MAAFTADRVKTDPARPIRSPGGTSNTVTPIPTIGVPKTQWPYSTPLSTTTPKTP